MVDFWTRGGWLNAMNDSLLMATVDMNCLCENKVTAEGITELHSTTSLCKGALVCGSTVLSHHLIPQMGGASMWQLQTLAGPQCGPAIHGTNFLGDGPIFLPAPANGNGYRIPQRVGGCNPLAPKDTVQLSTANGSSILADTPPLICLLAIQTIHALVGHM